MGSEEPRHKIAIGYPSIDRYQYQSQTATAYPVPCHPQGYPATSLHDHNPAPPYLSSSFHHQGYNGGGSSSFAKGKYASPASKNPYSPSFNEYYYQQPYNPLPVETDSGPSFSRVMLIFMVVLVSIMCLMSFAMWFLYGTYIPEFAVVSLTVSNLTATNTNTNTNTTTAASWSAGLTVKNNNDGLAVQFDNIRSSILYKEVTLGFSDLQSFQVPKKEMVVYNATVGSDPSLAQDKKRSSSMQSVADEKSNGRMVTFSLALTLHANFSTPKMVYRQENLRVLCEDLRVSFTPDGVGHLMQGNMPNGCLIRTRDSLD